MQVLYASERPPYPFFLGGAARSTHYLLSTLARDFEVHVTAVGSRQFGGRSWSLADIQDRDTLRVGTTEDDGATLEVQCDYPVRILDDFYGQLPALIKRESPDIVWTQLDGFERIAAVARVLGHDTVVYLRDAEDKPAMLRQVANAGCALFCNSGFMARRVQSLTGCRAGVIYPSLEYRFDVAGDPNGFITMVNPCRVKGIDTFLTVAREMPNERFLLVESWKLGPVALAELQQRLSELPNVTFMHRVADVGEIYARTRLLLVPSLWEEAFGRVVIEAQSCGIPVLASRRGGLPESVGDGGLCVADHTRAPAWVAAIRSVLDDPGLYLELSARARAHAESEQFTTQFAARTFLTLCADRSLFGAGTHRRRGGWLDRLRGAWIEAGAGART